jgi:hypothetical protein
MRLTVYFQEWTKDDHGTMIAHIIKCHSGAVLLDSKVRGTPQAVIEIVEAIWGPDWHDGYWENNRESA